MENNQIIPTEENAVALGAAIPNLEQLLEESTQLETLTPAITLSAESISLEKVGESFRGIFIGFGTMTINDPNEPEGQRTIKAARFLINKQVRINGGVVLISELESANVLPGTKLEVTYSKKEGNVKIYSLTLLG
jgi:hypothetical protein